MYSEISDSWLKHWDFIILDMVMLQIAYIFSCMMRRGDIQPLWRNIISKHRDHHPAGGYLFGIFYGTLSRDHAQRILYGVQEYTEACFPCSCD